MQQDTVFVAAPDLRLRMGRGGWEAIVGPTTVAVPVGALRILEAFAAPASVDDAFAATERDYPAPREVFAEVVTQFMAIGALIAVAPDPNDAAVNRAWWDAEADSYAQDHGAQLGEGPIAWGTWAIPEAKLGALGPLAGSEAADLGCGPGFLVRKLAAGGARVVGIDVSAAQIAVARTGGDPRGAEAGEVRFVRADAAALPLEDNVLDLVVSDYGALTYSDPARVLPEVARVLRPGGRVVVCTATRWPSACWDAEARSYGERLVGPYFGVAPITVDDGRMYALTQGRWVTLLAEHGFRLVALHELRPPTDATSSFDGFVPTTWARRWPAEALWVADLDEPAGAA